MIDHEAIDDSGIRDAWKAAKGCAAAVFAAKAAPTIAAAEQTSILDALVLTWPYATAIVAELKKNSKFTLPSFGTFTVRKTKARKGLNPRTGEAIKVKAGKTVRFKASPTLKKDV